MDTTDSQQKNPSPCGLLWSMLCLLMAHPALAQSGSLPVLKPQLGPAPDISVNAARNHARNLARWQRIDSLVATYPSVDEAAKHISKTQFSFWEQHLDGLPDDYLAIGPEGCSWYCGGGPDSVYASSVLPSNGNLTYAGANAHDFSLRTAWVEGVPGHGVGQRIFFRFPKNSPPVTAVELYNGYMKSEKAWRDNSRIKQLRLYRNGKPYALLDLRDTTSSQRFEIGSHQATKSDLLLSFEITAVYPGRKYDDTALADVIFDGTGVHCFAAGTQVTMAEGAASKTIENILPGDRVLSLNERTGALEPATVLEVAASPHHNLYHFTFDDRSVIATADHPFYRPDGSFAAIQPDAAAHYIPQSVQLLGRGTVIYCLENGTLLGNALIGAQPLPHCATAYTIVRLDRNRIFFANGLAVATEALIDQDF